MSASDISTTPRPSSDSKRTSKFVEEGLPETAATYERLRPGSSPLIPYVDETAPPQPKSPSIISMGRKLVTTINPFGIWRSFTRAQDNTKDAANVQTVQEYRRQAAAKYRPPPNRSMSVTNDAWGVHRRSEPATPTRTSKRKVADNAATDTMSVQTNTASASAPVPAAGLTMVDTEHARGVLIPENTLKARRSLFNLRRPSMGKLTLKRTRSECSLSGVSTSSPKIPTTPTTPTTPSSPTTPTQPKRLSPSLSPSLSHTNKRLRRSQSRLLTQNQKLSRKVSDLELQLQEARRELSHAITAATPMPPPPSPATPVQRPAAHLGPPLTSLPCSRPATTAADRPAPLRIIKKVAPSPAAVETSSKRLPALPAPLPSTSEADTRTQTLAPSRAECLPAPRAESKTEARAEPTAAQQAAPPTYTRTSCRGPSIRGFHLEPLMPVILEEDKDLPLGIPVNAGHLTGDLSESSSNVDTSEQESRLPTPEHVSVGSDCKMFESREEVQVEGERGQVEFEWPDDCF